jgi:hypothetical protein
VGMLWIPHESLGLFCSLSAASCHVSEMPSLLGLLATAAVAVTVAAVPSLQSLNSDVTILINDDLQGKTSLMPGKIVTTDDTSARREQSIRELSSPRAEQPSELCKRERELPGAE